MAIYRGLGGAGDANSDVTKNEISVLVTEASTAATEALASANDAATSETNAANSAANAATSETNAATSESNAATSETNAEDSNLEAESWANEDEDSPVNSYSSGSPTPRDPTVYSAKHWANKAEENSLKYVYQDVESQTATSGQTVFTLTTLSYLPTYNNLAVYVNGVRMTLTTDYTETNSTTVTFVNGLQLDDEVTFVSGEILTNVLNVSVPVGVSHERYTAIADQMTFSVATPFTLGVNNIQVYVNGIRQSNINDYVEVSTTSIAFTSPLIAGDIVDIYVGNTTPAEVTSSASVQYLPSGTGAVTTNVQSKLRETVSVLDFGAVGDGIANDTAAIILAEAASDYIIFPTGTYYLGTSTWQPTADKTYEFQNATLKSGVTSGNAVEIGMDTHFRGMLIIDCDSKTDSSGLRLGALVGGIVQPCYHCSIEHVEVINYTAVGVDLYSDSNSGVYWNKLHHVVVNNGTGIGVRLKTTTGISKVNVNSFGNVVANSITGTGISIDGVSGVTFDNLGSEQCTVMNLDIVKGDAIQINGGSFENNTTTNNISIADHPDVLGVSIQATIDTPEDIVYNYSALRTVIIRQKNYANHFGRTQFERIDIGKGCSAGHDISGGILDGLRISGGSWHYRYSSGSPYYYFTSPTVASGTETGYVFRNNDTDILLTIEGTGVIHGKYMYATGGHADGGITNTAFGSAALDSNASGVNNTCIGKNAGTAIASTSNNTLVGYRAGQTTTGASNTFVGVDAGRDTTTGSTQTAIGLDAGKFNYTYTNTTCLGNGSAVAANDEVQAGNSSTTLYYYASAVRSDERDKADIRDTILGLDFINQLRPVDYKWDMRDDYREEVENEDGTISLVQHTPDGTHKRTRYHHGLIAQEVEQVIQNTGIDFGGYKDKKIIGGEDQLAISYEELIAPLIKAVQELSDKIKVLENK